MYGEMPSGLNDTAIVLIPKLKNSEELKDYWSISFFFLLKNLEELVLLQYFIETKSLNTNVYKKNKHQKREITRNKKAQVCCWIHSLILSTFFFFARWTIIAISLRSFLLQFSTIGSTWLNIQLFFLFKCSSTSIWWCLWRKGLWAWIWAT